MHGKFVYIHWGSCLTTGYPVIMSIRLAVSSDASAIYDVHTSSIREICSKYYKKEEIKAWISRQSEQRYLEAIAKAQIIVMYNDNKQLQGFGHVTRYNCDEIKLDATEEQGLCFWAPSLLIYADFSFPGDHSHVTEWGL